MSSHIFPKGFLWGSSTSAWQVEGGSIDNEYRILHEQGLIAGGGDPGQSAGFWTRYETDIGLMRQMHHGSFRMSVEWARVEPEDGRFDDEAIRHYRRIVEAVTRAGILPVVDLHHHSNPLWVCRDGGWMNPRVVQRLQRFGGRMAEALGDLVGVWLTINYPTGETWTDRSGHERQKVRGQKRVILAVMGVWPDGQHHLIHYEVAEDENADAWSAVCQHLIARGLDPKAVCMVVSDGTKGLLEALDIHLPQAKLQRCTVHKVRGFERYLKYQELPNTAPETGQAVTAEEARQQRRHTMKTEALEIFEAPSQADAERRLADFVAKWQPIEPDAIHNFTWGIKRCFTFYLLHPALHPLVRSTNALERFFREFRTKADEIGAFPNEDSGLTIFYLVMVREHAKHDRVDFAKTERH